MPKTRTARKIEELQQVAVSAVNAEPSTGAPGRVFTDGRSILMTPEGMIRAACPIIFSTTDLTPGVSALPTGHVYLVYE